jgi:hypothetical protein
MAMPSSPAVLRPATSEIFVFFCVALQAERWARGQSADYSKTTPGRRVSNNLTNCSAISGRLK